MRRADYNSVIVCIINMIDVINGENVIYAEKDIYVGECHLSGGKNLSARHGRACPGDEPGDDDAE